MRSVEVALNSPVNSQTSLGRCWLATCHSSVEDSGHDDDLLHSFTWAIVRIVDMIDGGFPRFGVPFWVGPHKERLSG